MLLSATLSKPAKNIEQILGAEYQRVKIKLITSSSDQTEYFAELYTQKQVFHKKMTVEETLQFIEEHAGKTFKNCIKRTETEEITILSNKKGEIKTLVKKINPERQQSSSPMKNLMTGAGLNKKKNYILQEGKTVPFLVRLGIMTAEGKVIASKYDKFRQINRFLEIFSDILPEITEGRDPRQPVSVVDFGSGKSYLTFAVHYYLTEIAKVKCQVFGLDLKKEVIEYCSRLAEELKLNDISFAVGNIADFGEDKHPDVIITLHACDTATDYALDYAIKHKAKAILSVPCCQHEINLQLKKTAEEENSVFAPVLKYGLIKERFSALLTDALRGELLEQQGYKVQMIEFIDETGTPKNLMIRAVKKEEKEQKKQNSVKKVLETLKINQTLNNLLKS